MGIIDVISVLDCVLYRCLFRSVCTKRSWIINVNVSQLYDDMFRDGLNSARGTIFRRVIWLLISFDVNATLSATRQPFDAFQVWSRTLSTKLQILIIFHNRSAHPDHRYRRNAQD